MNDPQNQHSHRTHAHHQRVPKRIFFFGTCAVIALVIFAIANSTSFSSLFAYVGDVLAPVTIGCIIAYLLNPILKFYEYVIFRKLGRGNLRRGLSLLLTVLTASSAVPNTSKSRTLSFSTLEMSTSRWNLSMMDCRKLKRLLR